MTILRRIGAVIAGMIVAFLLVVAAEGIAHKIYPPPPGTNMQDMEQVKAFVATLPLSVLLIVLTGWLIATFVATWLAARIAGTPIPGYIVGALLLCAGIANAFMHPAAGLVLDRLDRDLHRRDMGGRKGGRAGGS